jgi:SAM-dependent methyltransferase
MEQIINRELTTELNLSIVDSTAVCQTIGGYGALLRESPDDVPNVTTDEYAENQERVNDGKVLEYLLPLARSLDAKTVLDVGCGIGAMVRSFLHAGYQAYGVDLPGLTKHWQRLEMPEDRMFVVDPIKFKLPFRDDALDFAFTLGVIEHVGTSNGHSDRRPDYHRLRKHWLQELFRVIRPGGAMLIAGPNRRFPIDVAHDLDTQASTGERWLSQRLGVSVHKTWGENFLWAYEDIARYLVPHSYDMRPLSTHGFLSCARVPRFIRPFVLGYIRHLPTALLGTGFNPWVMALVTKTADR